MTFKILLGLALLIWYIYSSFKNSEMQKNKKTTANPTPAQKGKLEELMDRMIAEQQKKVKELNKPDPKDKKRVQTKITTNKAPATPQRQFLPFEKRRLSEPKEMPSIKQIERVMQREKKAVEQPVRDKRTIEQPVIAVKDYDIDLLNHDLPHKEHHLADDSKIKFSFTGTQDELLDFDVRKAVIYQTIFERKEY